MDYCLQTIFKHVMSRKGALSLQADIDVLDKWSNTWLLKFNPTKCPVLTLGKFGNIKYTHRYIIYGNYLGHVIDEKDLRRLELILL